MAVLVFILGLVIGSFLNVCIYRIPKKESIVYGSSHCVNCQTKLKPLDLIPIVSFLWLKGKCRYCQERVSFRYPLVELLTGILFLITYGVFGLQALLLKYLFIISLLIIITMIDLELQLIPDILVLMVFCWAFLWQLFLPQISWWQTILGASIGGGILLAIAVLSNGGMGGGDIKLMFAAGFFLGFNQTLLVLFIAFVTGGILGGLLLYTGKKEKKSPIPFGPFLALGILIACLWGEKIIDLYLKF